MSTTTPLPRCSAKHHLKWTLRNSPICDLCDAQVKDRKTFACKGCNYDVCPSCYHKPVLEALPSDVRNYTGSATATLFKTKLNRNYLKPTGTFQLPDIDLEHWGCYIHLEEIHKHVRVEYGGGTGRIFPGGTSVANCVVVQDREVSLKNEAGDSVTWRVLSDDAYKAEIANRTLERVNWRRKRCTAWFMVHYSIEYLAVEYNALNHSCQDFARGVLKDVMEFPFVKSTQAEEAKRTAVAVAPVRAVPNPAPTPTAPAATATRARASSEETGSAHVALVPAAAFAVACVVNAPAAIIYGCWCATATAMALF